MLVLLIIWVIAMLQIVLEKGKRAANRIDLRAKSGSVLEHVLQGVYRDVDIVEEGEELPE